MPGPPSVSAYLLLGSLLGETRFPVLPGAPEVLLQPRLLPLRGHSRLHIPKPVPLAKPREDPPAPVLGTGPAASPSPEGARFYLTTESDLGLGTKS